MRISCLTTRSEGYIGLHLWDGKLIFNRVVIFKVLDTKTD